LNQVVAPSYKTSSFSAITFRGYNADSFFNPLWRGSLIQTSLIAVLKIDATISKFMIDYLQKHAENITVAFDSVTALGRSYLFYTVSKGNTSMFVAMSQLKDEVHSADAEVVDAVKAFLTTARKAIGGSICSAAVDNAAVTAADAMIEKYAEECPEEPKMLRTRDPGHCIYLVAKKDSAKVKCMALLISEAKAIIKFLSVEQVAGIAEEAVKGKHCVDVAKTRTLSETRFYGAAEMMNGMLKNKPLFDIIEGLEYYGTRIKKTTKEYIAELLKSIGPDLWRRLHVTIKWFNVLKTANKLTSSESAYLPLVQAIRTD
jgi:hypothetical protein